MNASRTAWAVRVVRGAQRLLPADLRREYGDEMLAVFAERLQIVTTEQGRARGALYVVRTVVDLAVEAVADRSAALWRRATPARPARTRAEDPLSRQRSLKGVGRLVTDVLLACRQPGVGQDVRYALRSLSRAWGFTISVVGVLGAGLGLTAAVVSIAYGVLMRPFPYQLPETLVRIDWMATSGQSQAGSLDDLEVWRQARSLADAGPYSVSSIEIRDRGPAETVQMAYVGGRALGILGVQPQIGRMFSPQEDLPNGDVHKAILSDELWARMFGRAPEVLGRTIHGGDGAFEILGVMPPGFAFPNRTDLWVPVESMWARSHNPGARLQSRQYAVIGRLAAHATPEMARAELDTLTETAVSARTDATVRVRSLRNAETGDMRPYLVALLVATGCLLLICLMNVSGLQLARGLARGHEFAVRAAIGASVSRNLRTLLVENVVLACAGAAVAVLVAIAGVRLIVATIPIVLPGWMRFELSPTMLAACLVLGGMASVTAGLAAAWRALGRTPQALMQSGRSVTDRASLRRAFVVAEIALSTVLLVMAGLLIGTLVALQARTPGFRPEGVLTAQVVRAHPGSAAERARTLQPLHARVIETLAALPGVTGVAATSRLPLVAGAGSRTILDLTVTGASGSRTVKAPFFGVADVTPGYFAAIGIPLLRGRDFTAHDSMDSRRVVVVNERAVDQLWPGQDPLGQQVTWGATRPDNPPATVVGVVPNMRAFAAEGDSGLDFYYPYAQYPAYAMYYVLRTSVDPYSLIDVTRRTIQTIEPSIAVSTIKTMSRRMQEALWQTRLWGWLLALFAGAALFLAAAGLYGLVSYLVSLRSKEMGIRISLGATADQIAGLVLGEMLRLIGAGAALGIVTALAASQILAALLFEVSPTDVRLYVAVPLLVAVVTLVACCPPVLRSRRLDVMLVLNGNGQVK